MTNIVTAYCACTLCCGPHAAGITASGVAPIAGITVAGPRRYPFGTRVLINGRTYTLQDRTARRHDGEWDIYFASHAAARQFGRRLLSVQILSGTNHGPATVGP